jgi:superoxide dismutase, Cu-Zn family
MKYPHAALLVLAASAFTLAACSAPADQHDHATLPPQAGALTTINEAVAVIYPTKGNAISGIIYFTWVPRFLAVTKDNYQGDIHVHGTVFGLEPNSTHAIHIHEFGDQTSPDGSSAGSHFNPTGHKHGAPNDPDHHAGDLGNLTADASGNATIDLTLPAMQASIIGRGVVIHAKPDDFKTQPTGNAGGRIGVGVIGIAKPTSVQSSRSSGRYQFDTSTQLPAT